MSSFDESWLTAYIDDELSEDERRFVESKLASDPLLKKVLEDLYQVRSMVVGLQPGVLESDLTQSVLGKIQNATPSKEPLASPATTAFDEPRKNVGSVQTRSVSQSPSPSPRTTGNWQWFGVAMAASIVGGLLYFKPWLDIPSLPVAMENIGERAGGNPAAAHQEMVQDQPMELAAAAVSNRSTETPSEGAMAPKAARGSITTDALVMGPATSASPELGPTSASKAIANSIVPDAFGTGGQGEGRLRSEALRVDPGLPMNDSPPDSKLTDKATGEPANNPRRSTGAMEKSEEGRGPGGGGFGGGRGLRGGGAASPPTPAARSLDRSGQNAPGAPLPSVRDPLSDPLSVRTEQRPSSPSKAETKAKTQANAPTFGLGGNKYGLATEELHRRGTLFMQSTTGSISAEELQALSTSLPVERFRTSRSIDIAELSAWEFQFTAIPGKDRLPAREDGRSRDTTDKPLSAEPSAAENKRLQVVLSEEDFKRISQRMEAIGNPLVRVEGVRSMSTSAESQSGDRSNVFLKKDLSSRRLRPPSVENPPQIHEHRWVLLELQLP